MDKYDIVLDLIEHPEKNSSEKIQEILSDPETKEIYNLLCKTESTFASNKLPDVDVEWEAFTRRHKKTRFIFLKRTHRAASIAALAFISLAVGAITIAVSTSKFEREQPAEAISEEIVDVIVDANTTTVISEVAVPAEPILFEDETLENITSLIAKTYGKEVEFKSLETARLRLFYRFDTVLPFEDVIEQLNTFEQINIHIDGNKIIVD